MGKTVYLVSIKNNSLDCLNYSKNFCIDRHDAGKSIYNRLDLLNRSQLHNVTTYLRFCQRSKGSKGRMFPRKRKVYARQIILERKELCHSCHFPRTCSFIFPWLNKSRSLSFSVPSSVLKEFPILFGHDFEFYQGIYYCGPDRPHRIRGVSL